MMEQHSKHLHESRVLIETKSEHGHNHSHATENYKQRFFVASFFTILILIFSPTIQRWFNFSLPEFTGKKFFIFLLASVVALYAAQPFYRGAIREIKNKNYGMMFLVSLAVFSGYIFSAIANFVPEITTDYFWEISTLVTILLFGHWIEMRVVTGATHALEKLGELIPQKTNLMKNNTITTIDTKNLNVGDIILVKPGEKIPADGKIVEGISSVNESIITGEFKPVTKKIHDEVIAGTINIDGALMVQVTKVGSDTIVSEIKKLVEQSLTSKPPVQRLADKAANFLTISAVFIATTTFIIWTIFLNQSFAYGITLAITVIVVACPHALGLAIPTVTTTAASMAAKNGILIKTMSALENVHQAKYVIFDKTGTLTLGELTLTNILAVNGYDENKLLPLTLALTHRSSHPVSKTIAASLRTRGTKQIEISDFQNLPGRGVRATMEHLRVLLGNQALMSEFGVNTSEIEHLVRPFYSQGKTVSFLAVGAEVKGIFALSDKIRKESYDTVQNLKKLGLKVAMLTGDNHATASYVAETLGLDTYFANLSPAQKVEKVKELQNKGYKVVMVGDGINDAPALTQANVGIAIGAGTDIAQESSDIILVTSNPLNVVRLISLAKKTKDKMRQNLFWATAYNVVAMPAAAGLLMPIGIALRPEWGALAMSASSVIVVVNALTLRREKLG